MPLDKTQLAELEAEINDEQLSKVRFGRSRFLRDASLALFGLTAGMFAVRPQEAEAAPPGCYGAITCGHCRGATCRGCRRRANSTCAGGHCWRVRIGCRIFRCCDWITKGGHLCVCRGFVGRVC